MAVEPCMGWIPIKKNKTSCKGIGGHKKTQKISKGKTTTLMYFDNLKKKQQDQGGKNWY